jgi:glycosyltransferase involved in cell wall biosynthesis
LDAAARPRISALVNTLNEESRLPFALRTLAWCDEVVVVDMESEDATAEVATKAGARVFSHPRVGSAQPARQFGIERCEGDWILILDADELVPPQLARRLREVAGADEADVVWLPRRNIWFGRWIRRGVAWPDAYPRFFKPGFQTVDDRLHSKPEPSPGARVLRLPAEEQYALVHAPGETLADAAAKAWRYAAIEAEEQRRDGVRFGWARFARSVAREFVGRLIVRQGFRDGREGMAVTLIDGLIYPIFMWLRLWEIETGEAQRRTTEEQRLRVLKTWEDSPQEKEAPR